MNKLKYKRANLSRLNTLINENGNFSDNNKLITKSSSTKFIDYKHQ